jgi:peptidoglycan/xylan/chitin deacetylase (PgdA/CDA1 family)
MSRPAFLTREGLGKRLARAGMLKLVRPLHDGLRTPLVVLAYHRVLPMPDAERYPFDLGLVSTTPEEFDWQMGVIKREFDPISLSDIASFVRGRFKLPKRPIVVTFDDGYEDNYTHAFPILKRHGVPATVFVTVGHIGTSNLLWHDWAAYLALRAQHGEIPTLNGPRAVNAKVSVADRRLLVRQFLLFLKTQPHAKLLSMLAAMRAQHADAIRPDELPLARTLSWEQVQTMSESGVQFGSHTVSHSILIRLSPEELQRELLESKATLEARLNTPCDTIAYPVGRSFSYTPKILAEVGLAGYRVGLAYNAGTNWAHALDLFALQRQSVELDTTRDYFRAMATLPAWFQ